MFMLNVEQSRFRQKYPSKVFHDESTRVWHKLDKKFKTPHAQIEVFLASPIIKRSKEKYEWLSATVLIDYTLGSFQLLHAEAL